MRQGQGREPDRRPGEASEASINVGGIDLPAEVVEQIRRQLLPDASNNVEVDEGSVGWDKSPAASAKGGIQRMNGQEKKGFLEKQLPTVYALWKTVQHFRSGSGNSSQVKEVQTTISPEPVPAVPVAPRVPRATTQIVAKRQPPQPEAEEPSAPPAAGQQPNPPQSQPRPQPRPPPAAATTAGTGTTGPHGPDTPVPPAGPIGAQSPGCGRRPAHDSTTSLPGVPESTGEARTYKPR